MRERAVRLIFDNKDQHGSRGQAILSIAAKIGCSAHTLNERGKSAEVDNAKHAGIAIVMADKMKALERAIRELRQANEILKKASAYFAMAELFLWVSRLLMQKGAAARHRKLRGSGGGGVVRSLVFQDRGRV